MDLCSYCPSHATFASRPAISMSPEPIDHTVHDFLVVPLQHQGVAVASDAGFRQHINGHVATEGLHPLLERARCRDAIWRAIADDDDDRHLDEPLHRILRYLVETSPGAFDEIPADAMKRLVHVPRR